MNERERWIVYPLLFLALGVALRDELFDQTWSRNVVCEQLTLIDSQDGSPSQQVRIGSLGRAGEQGIAPGGELRVGMIRADTIRARTVIAEHIGARPPRPTLINLLRSLSQAAQAKKKSATVKQVAPVAPDADKPPGDSAATDSKPAAGDGEQGDGEQGGGE